MTRGSQPEQASGPTPSDDGLVRLEIDVPRALAEAATAIPWLIGAQGVELRDEITGHAEAGRAIICAWVPAAEAEQARRRAEAHLGPMLPSAFLRLVAEDARGWQSELPDSVSIGTFEVLADAPDRAEPGDADGADDTAPQARRLLIEPGSAFGDGAHPTTILCVRAIEARFAADGEAGPPGRVLDVGTGTGILALVAARLGARVVGTDIDPLARRAAVRHAHRNGLAERVTIASSPPEEPFDLVVANLYLDPLIALAPTLAARVAPGGRCIVSGIADRHRARIERAFGDCGLEPVTHSALDGWIALGFAAPCAHDGAARGRPIHLLRPGTEST